MHRYSLLFILLLAACQKEPTVPTETVQPEALNSSVVVRVNGEAITAEDVDYSMATTFSPATLALAGEDLRSKVVDSLIASKAMSQQALAAMSVDQSQDLERKVAAYKEELLVKNYLEDNVEATPVTSEMVEQYYHKHPQMFGATERIQLQLLAQPKGTGEQARQGFLERLNEIKSNTDWHRLSEANTDLKLSLEQRIVMLKELSPKQRLSVSQLEEGQTSANVVVDDGSIYLIRLIERKQVPPKPLAEVSADIRKRLAPIQLKTAVKQASQMVLKGAEIKWENGQ